MGEILGKTLIGKNLMQKKLGRWEKKSRKNGPKNLSSKVGGRLMITLKRIYAFTHMITPKNFTHLLKSFYRMFYAHKRKNI
jgi:hypothetical protein